MGDVPPDEERTQGASEDTPLTGWARGAPAGPPDDGSETPTTGWIARPRDPVPEDEPTRAAGDPPQTGWEQGAPGASPEEGSRTPATGWMARPQDPVPEAGSETPATGWTARPFESPSQSGTAQPDDAEATAATGWVIAGMQPPATRFSAASSAPPPGAPAGGGPSSGWPQAPAISWAQAPMDPSATQPPAGWAAAPRRRGRSCWFGPLAGAILAILLVAGGGIGFMAGSRPAPIPTPRAQPTLQPTVGPIGTVDSPLITFRLPAGWLEQQQTTTDVKLVRFPNGSMDINAQSTSAVGASTPQAVLQKAEQRLSTAPDTVGPVSTCVQPAAHTIDGRPGFEQGFQLQERGTDGKTLLTNCDVAWASVQNGQVYFWEAFNTIDQLQATTLAATRMQRSAHWQE